MPKIFKHTSRTLTVTLSKPEIMCMKNNTKDVLTKYSAAVSKIAYVRKYEDTS